MKRNLLLPCLVAGWWAIALPTAFAAETASEEINRLRAEIGELEIQLSNPGAGSQQTMLRQSLREKIRRMEEAQQQLRSGASTTASRPATPSPTEPSPPKTASPTAPARESTPMPRATLPPPRAAVNPPPRQSQVPPSPAPAAPRAAATSSTAPLPEVPLPGAAPLTIYTAQELAIGPGTMSNLDEVARLLRTKSYDDARREWNGYVAGERDLFEAQPARLKALIHFVARRAYVEPDDDLSIAATQVDAAREKKDAAGIARAQDAFTARLGAKAELAAQVRQALGLLQTVADGAMRPRR